MSIKKDVFSEIEAIYPELVELRHQIHANPELSYAEFATAALIEEQLKKWGIPYVRLPDSTAIVAMIRGQSKQSPCIGIRADMDALPIEEAAKVSYQSKKKGIMHACGHDIHTVNLLGSGYVLNQLKNRFAGCVKLVFQPAEEVGGGAKELIDYGVLDNPPVSAFLATHVSEDVPVGSKHSFRAGLVIIKINGRIHKEIYRLFYKLYINTLKKLDLAYQSARNGVYDDCHIK